MQLTVWAGGVVVGGGEVGPTVGDVVTGGVVVAGRVVVGTGVEVTVGVGVGASTTTEHVIGAGVPSDGISPTHT